MIDEITVTVQNPATDDRDDYGDGPSDEPPEPVDIPGCLFAPGTTSERADPRSPAVITGGTIYVDAAHLELARSTITPKSTITVPGQGTFTVEGDLGIWGTAGIELAVKKWTGRAA